MYPEYLLMAFFGVFVISNLFLTIRGLATNKPFLTSDRWSNTFALFPPLAFSLEVVAKPHKHLSNVTMTRASCKKTGRQNLQEIRFSGNNKKLREAAKDEIIRSCRKSCRQVEA
jgi:hypothetical protein